MVQFDHDRPGPCYSQCCMWRKAARQPASWMAGLLISGISLGGREGRRSVDGTQLGGVCVRFVGSGMVGILSLGCVTGVHLTFHARGIGSGPYLDVCVPRTAHTSCTQTQEKVQKTIPVGLSLPHVVLYLPLFSFPVTYPLS